MSFLWLVWHNVWSKKVRSGLTSIAVAIGVATVVVLGIVTESIRTTAAGVLQVGAADFTVAQQGVDDILNSALTEQQLARVAEQPGVRSAIGVLLATEGLDEAHPLVVEVGLRPEDLKPFGVQVAAGRPFAAEAPDEAMLGIRLAQDLGKQVGDTVHVAGEDRTVVGIFNTGNVFGDGAVMLPLVTLQAEERKPAGLSLFFVKTDRGVPVKRVQREVGASSPLLVPIRNLIEFGRADRSYQLITAADRAARLVAVGIGALIVGNAMLLSLVERYREFGVLRAVGWTRRRLVALVAGEATVIAFLGAALGVGIAFGASELLAQLPQLAGVLKPDYGPYVFVRALVTAAAVTVLGAMYPALRAASLAPQEAMRRE